MININLYGGYRLCQVFYINLVFLIIICCFLVDLFSLSIFILQFISFNSNFSYPSKKSSLSGVSWQYQISQILIFSVVIIFRFKFYSVLPFIYQLLEIRLKIVPLEFFMFQFLLGFILYPVLPLLNFKNFGNYLIIFQNYFMNWIYVGFYFNKSKFTFLIFILCFQGFIKPIKLYPKI